MAQIIRNYFYLTQRAQRAQIIYQRDDTDSHGVTIISHTEYTEGTDYQRFGINFPLNTQTGLDSSKGN